MAPKTCEASRMCAMLSFVLTPGKPARALVLASATALGVGLGSASAQAQPKNTPKPPRVDGIYLGLALEGGAHFIQIAKEPQTDAYTGYGASLLVGEQIFPWFSMGLRVGYVSGAFQNRRGGMGWLQLDAGFYPLHRITPKEHQLSVRLRTGLGGGLVRIPGQTQRKGVGGAAVGAAIRYEWFPWARCRRPRVGGGLAFAPEISVTGYPRVSSQSSQGISTLFSVAVLYHFGS